MKAGRAVRRGRRMGAGGDVMFEQILDVLGDAGHVGAGDDGGGKTTLLPPVSLLTLLNNTPRHTMPTLAWRSPAIAVGEQVRLAKQRRTITTMVVYGGTGRSNTMLQHSVLNRR